jgi:hypothetical protein
MPSNFLRMFGSPAHVAMMSGQKASQSNRTRATMSSDETIRKLVAAVQDLLPGAYFASDYYPGSEEDRRRIQEIEELIKPYTDEGDDE